MHYVARKAYDKMLSQRSVEIDGRKKGKEDRREKNKRTKRGRKVGRKE